PDSIYGPATAAAVAAFKRKRQILNFAGQIDNIVGKKTMAALDGEMLAKERGGGGGRPGSRLADAPPGTPSTPVTPGTPVTIVPFTRTKPMILKEMSDNRDKGDLNADDPPKPALLFAEKLALGAFKLSPASLLLTTPNLEILMEGELSRLAGALGSQ